MYATLETYDEHDNSCPFQQKQIKENFEIIPLKPKTCKKKKKRGLGIDAIIECQPYNEKQPYLYMFDPYYSEFPYDPDYQPVNSEDDVEGARYLDIFPSYPSSDSTTRVFYRDFQPVEWEYINSDLQQD